MIVLNPRFIIFLTPPNEPADDPSIFYPPTSSSSSAGPPPVSIFYNIYVPTDDVNGIVHAYQIIEDQIAQVGMSFLAGRKYVTLYYNTIGLPFNTTFMDSLCVSHRVKCKHLKHYTQGYEMITLHSLWEHCKKNETDPAHTVVYTCIPRGLTIQAQLLIDGGRP
jgi:hypothetical protein